MSGPAGIDQGGLDRVLSDPRLRRVLAALDGLGEETRVVGGAVRNALMGLPVRDVDLATTASPQETIRRARAAGFKVAPTGVEHGTVTVIVDGRPFEVTTLREDVETDGRFAVVRFGRDFAVDARRRDFTINALSVDADGELRDYVGGLDDVAARRVRFIGSANSRIREDYLRILRFFRFFAEYALGPIDPEGLRAAIAGRDGLSRLSRERIRAEFVRLLAAPRALETATLLAHSGLLDRLTGGVGDIGRLSRIVDNAAPDATLRLAAFDVMSEADVDRLVERLRLSNAETARLSGYARALAAMRGRHAALDGLALRRLTAEFGAQATTDAAAALRGEPTPTFAPDALASLAKGLAEPTMPLAGRDLMAAGLRPGPELGRALERAREAWIEGGCVEGEGERKRLLRLASS